MAYFSNGSAGSCFEEQCVRCRYGEGPCPIYWVQSQYNYDACNNEVATKILDELVKQDGTCTMFKLDENWFGSKTEQPDTVRKMLDALEPQPKP